MPWQITLSGWSPYRDDLMAERCYARQEASHDFTDDGLAAGGFGITEPKHHIISQERQKSIGVTGVDIGEQPLEPIAPIHLT